MPPAVRRSLASPVVLAGALALPAVALAGTGDAGLSPIDPSSPSAHGISDIYWFILAFAVRDLPRSSTVPLVVFAVRYRSRSRQRDVRGPAGARLDAARARVDGGPGAVILVLIASFTFYKLGVIDDPAGAAGDARHRSIVQGRQFYWQYVYPNGAITVNELRLPVDRVANLRITAPGARRDPQLLGAVAERQARRHPGPPEHAQAEAQRWWAPTRFAVRSSAGSSTRRWTAASSSSPAAEFDRWVAQLAAAAEDEGGAARARQGDLRGRVRDVPRPGAARASSAPRSPATRSSRTRAASSGSSTRASTRCPRSARAGARRAAGADRLPRKKVATQGAESGS